LHWGFCVSITVKYQVLFFLFSSCVTQIAKLPSDIPLIFGENFFGLKSDENRKSSLGKIRPTATWQGKTPFMDS